MRNRLTFANVIGVLLENKKKTYPQHQLVRSLFSAYLDDTLTASELIADDTTMYSRWCNGARPIPIDILKTYEDEDEWDTMEDDFRDKIIPNLLNEAQARIQMEELITDSIKTIGQEMADALIQEPDNAAFFCSVVRYAILNDHSTGALYSPDLSEVILCNKLPSCNQAFIGRKDEIKAIASHLSNQYICHLNLASQALLSYEEVLSCHCRTDQAAPQAFPFPLQSSHYRMPGSLRIFCIYFSSQRTYTLSPSCFSHAADFISVNHIFQVYLSVIS